MQLLSCSFWQNCSFYWAHKFRFVLNTLQFCAWVNLKIMVSQVHFSRSCQSLILLYLVDLVFYHVLDGFITRFVALLLFLHRLGFYNHVSMLKLMMLTTSCVKHWDTPLFTKCLKGLQLPALPSVGTINPHAGRSLNWMKHIPALWMLRMLGHRNLESQLQCLWSFRFLTRVAFCI